MRPKGHFLADRGTKDLLFWMLEQVAHIASQLSDGPLGCILSSNVHASPSGPEEAIEVLGEGRLA